MLFYVILAMAALISIASVIVYGAAGASFTSFMLAVATCILVIVAWFKINANRRAERLGTAKKSVRTAAIEDDGEYHNDFSKVPAGEPDNTPLTPRSIGYGYGDHGQAFEEDLAKLSRSISSDKNNEENDIENIKEEKK